jgi:mannose-6-phosphate isomerase-like protein (cupin superfamily)
MPPFSHDDHDRRDEDALMTKPIRRVVTGHNVAGKSVFISDGAAPNVYQRVPGSVTVTELWETKNTPADNRGHADAADRPFKLHPPKNGSVFRIIEYPPDKVRLAAIAKERTMADDGSGRDAATDRNSPRHPGMHKTDSIDYAIVLKGEIYALMDEGEVLLRPGDVLVQRGTNHAWSNRTDEPCTIAFVLIDAEPV